MTFSPLWPLWAIVIVTGSLLAFCVVMLVRRPRHRLDWTRRTVLGVILLGLVAGPAVVERGAATVQSNAEIFFVVDRTGSMAAEDWAEGTPRLDGVRHDIPAIVEQFPGARFTIIGWDSQATRQLPLTTDARAVRSWAETVRQELTTYSAGSQVDRPLGALAEALAGAAERNPANVRVVYFLSDGENTDGSGSSADADLASYAPLAELVDGGAVLGYGTAEGGRMRENDGTTPLAEAGYIQDPAHDGTDAVSRIDETTLRTIAEQLGVEYTHRIAPDDVSPWTSGIDVQDIAGDGRREQVVVRPVVWPLAIVAAALLAWEMFAIGRAFPIGFGSARDEEDRPRPRTRTKVGAP